MGSDGLMSRLATSQCELLVSVGRIPGTAMPTEWAASGAKLGFPVEVEFTDELCGAYEMTKERLLGESKGIRSMEPLNVPTFISAKGQETIQVQSGAYGCELQSLEAQQYTLRFFLDFPKGAVRNDVELPGERVYFLTSCWIKNDRVLERAQKRKEEVESLLKEVRAELESLASESSSIFQKAIGFRQSVLLVERKAKLESQLQEMEQTYPLYSDKLVDGPNGISFVKEGIVAVKRYKGAMGTREQYWWIGTFQISGFFDDEYEDEEAP